ncbi:tRNA lysidine(34) synthetase TilS [uncultured Litoreibacter sp.]|uniref:tRNA lysidine(34) synthetase TilS n=1 Tax=uncultured Litoreibacter sp. TaxID=1392394 RepID=UPI00260EAD63|nr:tRNA lysidine(34) synthetase TilS [uncultured Litoreibacter sp.]
MNAPELPDDILSLIHRDKVIGVAVSGGSDSMGLLHLLLQAGAKVSVATVNHNLRDEAATEAQVVADFCASHGVPHDVLHWRWDGQGNLSDQARRGRYDLLADWASRVGACAVALGHTADDNIETFLMGLSRGAGLDGLSGMRPEFETAGVTFLRPLLTARRADLQDVLARAGVRWCDDPTNDDPSYHRVQVRQNMNALKAVGISPEQILMSVSNLHATRRDVNADLARAVEGRFCLELGDVCFELDWVETLSPESQRRVLNSALQFVSGREYPPRGAKIMRVLADLRQKSVLHGCVITQDAQRLRIGREYSAVADLITPSAEVWDGRWIAQGPHSKTTEIRALGEAGLAQCGEVWRDAGAARSRILALPSIWDDGRLLAAPLAGLANNWAISLRQHENEYLEFVLSH